MENKAMITATEAKQVLQSAKDFQSEVTQILRQDDILPTFKEAMGYLRVSRSTLLRLMAAEEVAGYKVGHSWRLKKSRLNGAVKPIEHKENNA